MGIVDDAAKQGELVYAFNQSKSAVLTQPGPWGNAYSGYCAGLAMRWLKLRSQGQDYASSDKTMIDQPAITTKLQNVYEDQDYPKALADQALATLQTLQLQGPRAIASTLTGKNGLWLVSLRRPKGGHAVAIQSEPARGVYRYFDANFGHFRLSSPGRFTTWLNQFLVTSGYGARYTIGSVLRQVG
jgi:hypothetical protein